MRDTNRELVIFGRDKLTGRGRRNLGGIWNGVICEDRDTKPVKILGGFPELGDHWTIYLPTWVNDMIKQMIPQI